jgi:hypothetical protein
VTLRSLSHAAIRNLFLLVFANRVKQAINPIQPL